MKLTLFASLIFYVQFLVLTPNVYAEKEDILPDTNSCGKFNINSKTAQPKDFPWMVSLVYEKNQRKRVLCSGALISKRYILTTGVCLTNSWELVNAALGKFDVNTLSCIHGEICEEIPIEAKIPHENFIRENHAPQNDIALLKLKKDVSFSENIKPVCLPLSDELKHLSYEDKILTTSTWGNSREDSNKTNFRTKIQLTFINESSCANTLKKHNVLINSNQICVGGPQRPCRGDSGAPLMVEYTNSVNNIANWYAVGLVSFGPNSCDKVSDVPDIVTKVSAYADWITSKLN